MNINIKNAANNAYNGIAELLDFIENGNKYYRDVESFVDELNEIIVRTQP